LHPSSTAGRGAQVALDEVDLVRDLGEAVFTEVELVEDADRFALVEQLAKTATQPM